jgi:hypothetical protein
MDMFGHKLNKADFWLDPIGFAKNTSVRAQAAASRLADLMKEFHGNQFAAEAAYNFGSKTIWDEMPKNAWKGEYPGGINPILTSGQQAQMTVIIQNMSHSDLSAQAGAQTQ